MSVNVLYVEFEDKQGNVTVGFYAANKFVIRSIYSMRTSGLGFAT